MAACRDGRLRHRVFQLALPSFKDYKLLLDPFQERLGDQETSTCGWNEADFTMGCGQW